MNNTFYIGVENTVRVNIKGVSFDSVIASMGEGYGTIIKGDNCFIVKPFRKGTIDFKIYVQESNILKEAATKTFNIDLLPDPASFTKQDLRKEEMIISADSITLGKNLLIVKGNVTYDGKESYADGNIRMSFGNGIDKMPLIIYNGKEVTGIHSFTTISAKYRVLCLSAKDAIEKYGDKGQNGALEIDCLGTVTKPANGI